MKADSKTKLSAQWNGSVRMKQVIEYNSDVILRLSNITGLSFAPAPFDPTLGIVRSSANLDLFVAYPSRDEASGDAQANLGAEIDRVRKEHDQLTKNIASNQNRLDDETFRSRAPEHIVKGLEKTLAERRAELSKLADRLSQLEKNLAKPT
jgi:valyl-tRNA synthetase